MIEEPAGRIRNEEEGHSLMIRTLAHALVLFATVACLTQAAEIIQFDTYLDGTPVPEGYTVSDQWRSLGVVFSMGDSSRAAYAVPHPCSKSQPNHVGGDPVVIAWFVDPVTGAPAVTDFVGTAQDLCWGPGEGILMQAFDIDGGLVAQEFNSGSGHTVTFSFPEPTVAMLRMEEVGQGIDDFVFNIPVPAVPADVAQGSGAETGNRSGATVRVTPNPVAGPASVRIRLDLKEARSTRASLRIYDINGRLVRCLLNGEIREGDQVVEWNGANDQGRNVGPGTYLIRWGSSGASESGRVTVLR